MVSFCRILVFKFFCDRGILYDYLVLLYEKIKNENMWFNDSLFIYAKIVKNKPNNKYDLFLTRIYPTVSVH